MEEHGPKLKPTTCAEYNRVFRKVLWPLFGNRLVRDVDRTEVARFHAKMADKPNAANHALAVFSKFMNWVGAVGLREKYTNPCRTVKKYRPKQRQRFLSDEEIERLGAVLDRGVEDGESPYAIAAIRLLLFTGARLSEILTVEWRLVDLQRGLLALPDSKTGQKTIFLNEGAIEILNDIPKQPNNR